MIERASAPIFSVIIMLIGLIVGVILTCASLAHADDDFCKSHTPSWPERLEFKKITELKVGLEDKKVTFALNKGGSIESSAKIINYVPPYVFESFDFGVHPQRGVVNPQVTKEGTFSAEIRGAVYPTGYWDVWAKRVLRFEAKHLTLKSLRVCRYNYDHYSLGERSLITIHSTQRADIDFTCPDPDTSKGSCIPDLFTTLSRWDLDPEVATLGLVKKVLSHGVISH